MPKRASRISPAHQACAPMKAWAPMHPQVHHSSPRVLGSTAMIWPSFSRHCVQHKQQTHFPRSRAGVCFLVHSTQSRSEVPCIKRRAAVTVRALKAPQQELVQPQQTQPPPTPQQQQQQQPQQAPPKQQQQLQQALPKQQQQSQQAPPQQQQAWFGLPAFITETAARGTAWWWDDSKVERVYESDVYPTHRSSRRFYMHFVTLFRSYFLRDLIIPLIVLMCFAAVISTYETFVEMGTVPELPDLAHSSESPFVTTSFALSLMLGFRTNSSYARWLDARMQWGAIVTAARDVVRMSLTAMPAHDVALRSAIGRWTIACMYSIKHHLREDGDLAVSLKTVLLPEELRILLANTHRPVACLQMLGEILAVAESQGYFCSQTRLRLEAGITHIGFSLGACERILRNPIPLSYTRHTARFLVLWLVWLPIALWDKIHWAVVPVEGIVGYLLLGIDEIAVQLEEPFGILPLESLVQTVQRSVTQMTNEYSPLQTLALGYGAAPPPTLRTNTTYSSTLDSLGSVSVADVGGSSSGSFMQGGGSSMRGGSGGSSDGGVAHQQGGRHESLQPMAQPSASHMDSSACSSNEHVVPNHKSKGLSSSEAGDGVAVMRSGSAHGVDVHNGVHIHRAHDGNVSTHMYSSNGSMDTSSGSSHKISRSKRNKRNNSSGSSSSAITTHTSPRHMLGHWNQTFPRPSGLQESAAAPSKPYPSLATSVSPGCSQALGDRVVHRHVQMTVSASATRSIFGVGPDVLKSADEVWADVGESFSGSSSVDSDCEDRFRTK